MRDIEAALQEHKQAIIDAGYAEKQILGVLLYGSQNYGLATEDSDIDTKVILIPTLKDLCTKKAGFVKEYQTDNNEKVVVMDLIHYFDNLKKQNINYVETLFTDYKWINPKHEKIWASIQAMRDHIAYYDMNKAIQSMGHQAFHTLKQDSGKPKKYAMARYIAYFLYSYAVDRSDYESSLKQPPHVIKELLDIKTGKQDYTGFNVLDLRRDLEKIVEIKIFDDVKKKEKIDSQLLELLIAAVRHLDNL